MIGIVLVTHGRLAEEFVAALEHVVADEQEALRTVCIGPDDDMAARRQEIIQAVADVDRGAGVIVLTDMYGGTPSNLAIALLDQGNVEVVAGMNLPMLIKLASVRKDETLERAVEQAQAAGRNYIKVASKLLSGGDR